ncbi:hypothetical protein [Endozoicomonas sp. SESOKO4]|uniref:hypothetical protein n=1 Tax=Endozoicomonas sp. SESOKO4 TaxID=2828745 RepID=UPI002148D046|nr:hypothetical protein [Endozoicomonas sp. SESOKO4]
MNILNHAIKLITALIVTMSFCIKADITEQEKKEPYLSAGLVDYDIKYLIEVGTTPEEVLLFAQEAPMVSPYDIHRFTQRNITSDIVASFHPRVAGDEIFIEKILKAGLTPQTANRYVEADIDSATRIIAYAKYGIPSDLAGSLNKNGISVLTDFAHTNLQEAFEHGLTTEDLPRYKGLTGSAYDLKKLYFSKVPADFLHEAVSKNIRLEDATSLYFRGIDLDTYPSLISDQQTCAAYPTTHLEFEYLGNLVDYHSKKEPIPLPKALFFRLNTLFTYDTMDYFSTNDQEEIFKYVEDIVKQTTKKPTIYSLLYLTALIVTQKLHYAKVDEGELKLTFSKERPIVEFWRRGIGDCDKYTVLGMVVFNQLKQLFPDVLANVYLTDKLFSTCKNHAWNTVVIAEEDRLIFTYIDITRFDSDIDSPKVGFREFLIVKQMLKNPFRNKNEGLGAMITELFDHQYFLGEYEKYFCTP